MTEDSLSQALVVSPPGLACSFRARYARWAKSGRRLLRQLVIAAILALAVGGYSEQKQAEAEFATLEADRAIATMREEAAEAAVIGGTQASFKSSSCSPVRRAI
jgi:hypothetical protein